MDKDNKISYDKSDILTVLKEIEYILYSLHCMGSYYVDDKRSSYESETTKFIDNSLVCSRLAAIRTVLSEKFDVIGEDEMDDFERVCQDIPYWKKPGDYCSDIWIEDIAQKLIDRNNE